MYDKYPSHTPPPFVVSFSSRVSTATKSARFRWEGINSSCSFGYTSFICTVQRTVHMQTTCRRVFSAKKLNIQSAGPVPLLIFCSISIFLLAGLVVGKETPVYCSRECTPPSLSTGTSNLLQPARAQVVLGQHSSIYIVCSYLKNSLFHFSGL